MSAPMRNELMRLSVVAVGLLLLSISSYSCEDKPSGEESMPKKSNKMSELESQLADPLLKFTTRLLKSVDRNKKNVILSPMSIHMALNLVLVGAETGSQTEKELIQALGYDGIKVPISQIHESYAKLSSTFRNTSEIGKQEMKKNEGLGQPNKTPILDMWTLAVTKDAKILPNYAQYIEKYYSGSFEALNRTDQGNKQKLLQRVNDWAKEAGFANAILSEKELNDEFKILLLSAVRVQAFWERAFRERTLTDLFYNEGLKSNLIKEGTGLSESDLEGNFAEFIPDASKSSFKNHLAKVSSHSDYKDLAALNFRAIRIPLGGDVSYTILEPLENAAGDELTKLSDALLGENGKLPKALQVVDSQVSRATFDYIQMPKFNFQSDMDIISSLRSMGLRKVFDREKAELTRLATDKLYVDKARHEAVIEVNKFGLKAAGVTKIRFQLLSATMKKEWIALNVQNPFLFVVRYGKLPLFVGQLFKLKSK